MKSQEARYLGYLGNFPLFNRKLTLIFYSIIEKKASNLSNSLLLIGVAEGQEASSEVCSDVKLFLSRFQKLSEVNVKKLRGRGEAKRKGAPQCHAGPFLILPKRRFKPRG